MSSKWGAVAFLVSKKISVEMSQSAIQNLSESLDLIKSTIEAVLNKEAEFQKLMAQEIASAEQIGQIIPEEPILFVTEYEEEEEVQLPPVKMT